MNTLARLPVVAHARAIHAMRLNYQPETEIEETA